LKLLSKFFAFEKQAHRLLITAMCATPNFPIQPSPPVLRYAYGPITKSIASILANKYAPQNNQKQVPLASINHVKYLMASEAE